MELPIQTVIEEAQRKVEMRALGATVDDRMRWVARRAYLEELKKSVESLRTVFVSYSREGDKVFRRIDQSLKPAGLTVNTGFMTTPEATTVIETIVRRMEGSCIFVGILTPDVALQEKTTSAPGVWTLDERGMAMALRKPLILMVHERVHRHYWKSVAAHQLYAFNNHSYKDVVKEVCSAVVALQARLVDSGS